MAEEKIGTTTTYEGLGFLWAYCDCGSNMSTPDNEQGHQAREKWVIAHLARCTKEE